MSSGSPYEVKIGFCRALRTGDRILVSGTAPIAGDGRNVSGGIKPQMHRCLEIISSAIAQLGGSLDDVVRTRTFLVSRDDWTQASEVHGSFFGRARPVATMLLVAGLIDPAWRVEVEAEAIVGASR